MKNFFDKILLVLLILAISTVSEMEAKATTYKEETREAFLEVKAVETDFVGYIPISTAEDLQKLNYSTATSKFYLTNDIDLGNYGY